MARDFPRLWDDFCDNVRKIGHEPSTPCPETSWLKAEGLRYAARLFRFAIGRELDPHSQPARKC